MTMFDKKSRELFQKALMIAPSGVHSDFRYAFPRFFESAKGSHISDVDGNEFIDYHLAFGAILLGHRNPEVINAVKLQLEKGDLWGMGSHMLELEVAEKICEHIPSAEKVRFSNSGSESSFHAIRLARSYSGKKKIIKFEGAYHGWHDSVEVGVFPSKEQLGKAPPNSSAIPKEVTDQTLVLEYNDFDAVSKVVRDHGNDIAGIIVEPILHSCGCIMPEEGFLKSIREITSKTNIVLIFDEVITGFRHSLGGVQDIFGVVPDLTILAKSIANGFPMGALCGKKEIMNEIEPLGRAHVAGTFCGHPISLAAAKATIELLENNRNHERLFKAGDYLRNKISKIIVEEGLPAQVAGYGSIFTVYFTQKKLKNYRDLKLSNKDELFEVYCSEMHKQGIFLAPQAYKRCHISVAHSEQDLRRTVNAARSALMTLKKVYRDISVQV